MYKIKCVAIDDEPLALNLVESFIEKTPYLSLIRGCESAYEAIDILKTHNIELLFLDINMPDIAGIDFFKTLSTPPCVIFTTAYLSYAV
ncbi:MAG: response regulator, partial [Bacteroidota bacterium]